MASACGIRAGLAYIELTLNDAKLVRGLQNAAKKLKAFGASVRDFGAKLAGLGAAVLAPLAGTTKVFGEMGDRMAKMSTRTGISVEALSELAFAAELSGVEIESLENGIRRMQRAVVEAGKGSATAQEALATLGLTAADLVGLSPDEQFKRIADRMARIQDPARRAAAAMELFGKSGTELIPLMTEGAAGIEALQEQARRLGLTMSTEDAKAAEQFNDTLDILWKVIKQGVFAIGAALAPSLQQLVEWITRAIVTATQWIKRNKETIITIFKVAAAVVAAGIALVGLGVAISTAGTILGAFAAVVSGVIIVVKVLIAVISAILTPVGLVIAAVAALGAYILYATGAAGQALSWLGERFNNLRNDATTAWQGISDALVAGDIALAARIVWLTLKMEWLKGVKYLQSVWLQFRNFFIKIAYGAFYGVQAVWEIVANALVVAWIELTAFASKTWTKISSGFSKAWNTAVTWTEKRIHDLWGLLDSGYDADAAKRMADQELASTNQQIDRETQAALTSREQRRQDERKMAEQMHEQEMARIGQESIDAEKELDDEYDAKLKAAQDDIDRTRKEWQDAIAEAKRKRQAAEAEKGPDKLKPPEDYESSFEGMDYTIQEQAQKTIGVAGTFNAMEARGLGAGGVTDRIAKASEETAKNTKKLVQEAQMGGLRFE